MFEMYLGKKRPWLDFYAKTIWQPFFTYSSEIDTPILVPEIVLKNGNFRTN